MSFLLGLLLGFLENGGYMSSVDATSKGKPLKAALWFLVYFGSMMGAVYFMTQQEYLGVLGVGVGGALGVALVASRNRKPPSPGFTQ